MQGGQCPPYFTSKYYKVCFFSLIYEDCGYPVLEDWLPDLLTYVYGTEKVEEMLAYYKTKKVSDFEQNQ